MDWSRQRQQVGQFMQEIEGVREVRCGEVQDSGTRVRSRFRHGFVVYEISESLPIASRMKTQHGPRSREIPSRIKDGGRRSNVEARPGSPGT